MRSISLNERARLARERRGLSPQAAADAIGCSRPTILRWEKDATSIGAEYLTKAAKVYLVRTDWLAMTSDDDGYPWESEAPPPPASQSVREQRDILTAAAVVMDYLRDFDSEQLTPERRKRRIDAALDVIDEVGIDRIMDGSMLAAAAKMIAAKTRGK